MGIHYLGAVITCDGCGITVTLPAWEEGALPRPRTRLWARGWGFAGVVRCPCCGLNVMDDPEAVGNPKPDSPAHRAMVAEAERLQRGEGLFQQ